MYNITHLFVCSADLSLWEPAQLIYVCTLSISKNAFHFSFFLSGSKFFCSAGFSSIIYMFDLIY